MKTYLHRISNTLLINGGYLSNPGLYFGEMGLVLFFYRYARFTQDEIYAEYGDKLFEKIKTKIQPDTPLDYKQGLSGIGSTVEYLMQNGYLDMDTDMVLEEVDKQLFFSFNLAYLSIDRIADIGYYALWRLAGSKTKKGMIIKSVLPHVVKAMEKWQTNAKIINPTVSFFKDLLSKGNHFLLHDDRSIVLSWHKLCCKNSSNAIKHFASLPERFANKSPTLNNALNLGIQNGLAGLGLFLMSELDGDDSWLSLFPNNIISYQNESILV